MQLHSGPKSDKKEASISNYVSGNIQSREPAFQFSDNRSVALNQSHLQQMANSRPGSATTQLKEKAQNTAAINSGEVIQRAVPGDGTPFKPQAATGSYRARGGQETPFDSSKHTRSRFGFGTNTRYEVFSRFNPTKQGNRIVSIRGSHGAQVNVEGIQLDHQTSWDTISSEMDKKNKDQSDGFYSFWDAKMYYNDINNLVPALGALNAAAGESGVTLEPRQDSNIEAAAGAVQHSWMHLQQVMGALNAGQGNTQVSDEEMTDALLQINSMLSGLAEKLLG